MSVRALISCVAPAALALAGCTGSNINMTSGTYFGNMQGKYPYEGYYDGTAGPIYDGYWGKDGVFYYRSNPYDRHFRAGSPDHFKRKSPGGRFEQMRGTLTPIDGVEMPEFPHSPSTEANPPLAY